MHSQDGGLACGGGDSINNGGIQTQRCDRGTAGSWTRTSTHLIIPRQGHVSWSTAEGVFLIGGWHGATTSELVKEDGSVEEGFALKYSTM